MAKCAYAVVKVSCIKCLNLKKGKFFSKPLQDSAKGLEISLCFTMQFLVRLLMRQDPF